MALVLGENSGFVSVAPTADPGGNNFTIDNAALATKHTSPATAIKIIEIGWWCDNATEEANFEVGLYAADGAVVPGEAGTLLQVSRTNAKGTTAGWKVVTVDWAIDPSTAYWIGLQVDNTATLTSANTATTNGVGLDNLSSQTTLPDPYGGGAIADTDAMAAIYAVWETADVSITPAAGSLSLVGAAATVVLSTILTPTAGALSLTGQTPVVRQEIRITPDAGSLGLTGQGLTQEVSVIPSAGALSLTGGQPTQEIIIHTPSGAITFVGTQAIQGYIFVPDAGTLTLTGGQGQLYESTVITPSSGSLSLTGQGLTQKIDVFPTAGSLSLTGQTPTQETSVFPSAGALSLTGGQPTLVRETVIVPTAGTLILAGQEAGVFSTRTRFNIKWKPYVFRRR